MDSDSSSGPPPGPPYGPPPGPPYWTPPYPPRPMPKRKPVWPWVLGAVLFAIILFVVTIGSMFSSFAGSFESQGGQRTVHESEDNAQGVFVEIPVEGVIVDARTDRVNPVDWVRKCLEQAAEEPNLKGILLRVNSPGGGIRASEEILKALREFKGEHDVPLVVWMSDVAASGGYYVSMCSDWIVCHDSTITASIGVIWSTMNWQGLMNDKLGVKFEPIKSAPMKDIGSPDRQMTAREKALIQEMVDQAFARFIEVVVDGRAGKGKTPVTEESVLALQSTILNGTMAFEKGLVDELGFRESAIAKLKELSGIERAEVVEFTPPMSFLDIMLAGKRPVDPLQGHLARLSFLYTEGPPLLALWER